MAQAPNAILAINSLDRYQTGVPGSQTGFTDAIARFINATGRFAPNNFQIGSPGALIYGYMNRLIVSQVQLQYNVPTVIPDRNDFFAMFGWVNVGSEPFASVVIQITIPFGYYTPQTLAALLTVLINQTDFQLYAPNFTVSYDPVENTFRFESNEDTFFFYFISPGDYSRFGLIFTDSQVLALLKTYTLLGITETNSSVAGSYVYQGAVIQTSTTNANFLYTPYVDIISETLTKYQNVKDTDTSAQKINNIVARVYLSGVGIPQSISGIPNTGPPNYPYDIPGTPVGIPGTQPFIVVQDLNSPKVIRWSPNEAVNSIDFQLRDQYGDLLFYKSNNEYFYTEFQMTIMCIEKD